MIIKDLAAFVYDVEVFSNLFTCTVMNTESGNIVCYEVSDRKNELLNIARLFLYKNIIFVGYNNHHYDDILISYIILNYKELVEKPI